MSGKIIIRNGRLPDGSASSIVIEDGAIVAVGAVGTASDGAGIDAEGHLIAPGIVDLGVFKVDRAAFRAGGIVRAALMPDGAPPLDEPGQIRHAASSGKPDLWVHPIGAATVDLNGERLAEYQLMREAGAVAIATGRRWIADSRAMEFALRYAAAAGLPLIAHAEDGWLTAGTVATAGETATRLGLAAAPSCAERIAIARDLALAELTGAQLHFRMVTTAAGLALVRAAKASGRIAVTCGIAPEYLLLTDKDVADFRTFARLSPPLRDESDRQACLAALADGTIDVLCSAHDPQGPEDKRLPFEEARPGAAGAETLLALGLGLVRDGTIGLPRLFELLAASPARLLGLPCGALTPGNAADIILVDPEAPWQIRSDAMAAKAGNTPFDGLPVQGRVIAMLKGGERVD